MEYRSLTGSWETDAKSLRMLYCDSRLSLTEDKKREAEDLLLELDKWTGSRRFSGRGLMLSRNQDAFHAQRPTRKQTPWVEVLVPSMEKIVDLGCCLS